MTKKVFIVNGQHAYHQMFENRGWEVTEEPTKADLVQFCGGSDVTPYLYDREPMPQTAFSTRRDSFERKIFEEALKAGLPLAGICRGAQFLCVMAGHELYQHVNGHALKGTHTVVDVYHDKRIQVSSTHHQMMKLRADGLEGVVVAIADEATERWYKDEEGVTQNDAPQERPPYKEWGDDLEAVFFSNINALAYQPHPEYGEGECQDYYFELLEEYLGV